jgi:hypothetical protein
MGNRHYIEMAVNELERENEKRRIAIDDNTTSKGYACKQSIHKCRFDKILMINGQVRLEVYMSVASRQQRLHPVNVLARQPIPLRESGL